MNFMNIITGKLIWATSPQLVWENLQGMQLKRMGRCGPGISKSPPKIRPQKKVASGLKDIVILDSSNTGSTGVDYIVAVDKKGELWAWGENHAPLETAAPRVMKQPVKITKNPKRKTENSFGPVGVQVQYTAVAASSNGAMFLTKDKELLLTMYNSGYVPYGLNKKVTSIANNKYNVYWISDGKLWVYGSNNQLGQLGRGVKLK